jgi:lipoprotein-anchoring transpeptidase ErfK/SrfK
MRLRLLARLAVAAGVMAALTVTAQANPAWDPEGKYTGGAPASGLRNWNFMGGGAGMSPIPRTTVNYSTGEAPGTIVVNTGERRLYLVLGNGQALRYGIGVGRVGFTWAGVTRIAAKKEWPDWTPPAQMLRRRPDLPRFMKGGPENPLGARALYLGSSLFRIHGSNEPETIGTAVSSGCFRMVNDDVIDLYNRVRVGAKVIVLR